MPDTALKELLRSDQCTLRKLRKTSYFSHFSKTSIFNKFLDIFSVYTDQISKIHSLLHQASRDTSFEYPHDILLRKFFSPPKDGLDKTKKSVLTTEGLIFEKHSFPSFYLYCKMPYKYHSLIYKFQNKGG